MPAISGLALLESHLLLGQPCKQRRIDAPLALLRGALRSSVCGKCIEGFHCIPRHNVRIRGRISEPSELRIERRDIAALHATGHRPIRWCPQIQRELGLSVNGNEREPDSMLLPDAHCLNFVTTPPTGAATEPDSLRSTVTVTERSSSYGSDCTTSVPERVVDSNAAGSGSRVSRNPPHTPATSMTSASSTATETDTVLRPAFRFPPLLVMHPHSVLLRAESKRCHYRRGGIRRQILVVQIPTRSRYWHSRQTWLCGTITRFSLTFRRYGTSSPKQIMIAHLNSFGAFLEYPAERFP